VYTFATPKLQPLITKPEGKNLIQACLNAPDVPATEYGNQAVNNYESGDDNGKDSVYDERSGGGGQASGIPVNYAAAMAGLAGFQYPSGQGNAAAASAAFLNAAHYPAYAAQYNAALAAGYWPGTLSTSTTNTNATGTADRGSNLTGGGESVEDSPISATTKQLP
jgi:hypothetical protein